jgi:hypothetical protein
MDVFLQKNRKSPPDEFKDNFPLLTGPRSKASGTGPSVII